METELQKVLKSLTHDQREQLMIAFNSETDSHVEYKEGFFIAVHLSNFDLFEVTETRGCWSIGRLKK